MENRIKNKFEQLEDSRKALISTIDSVDESVLNKSPRPGKWSVNQIIYHLQKSERASYNYVTKKLQSDDLTRNGYKSKMASLILKIAFILPFKYNAPKVVRNVPENLYFTDLSNTWEKNRNALWELITALPEETARRNIYRHPAAGRLNLIQMLTFFQDHFDRHRRQVLRILKQQK